MKVLVGVGIVGFVFTVDFTGRVYLFCFASVQIRFLSVEQSHRGAACKKRETARRELKREARTQKERCTVALVPRTTTVLLLVHSNRVTIIKLAKLVLAPREYSRRDVPADQYLLRDKEIRGTCSSLIIHRV